MGILVVHCENRTINTVIEVGDIPIEDSEGNVTYFTCPGLRWFVNGYVYEDLEGFDGTIIVGTPIPAGRLEKLPRAKGWDGRDKVLSNALAPFTGAEVETEPVPEAKVTKETPPTAENKKEASK